MKTEHYHFDRLFYKKLINLFLLFPTYLLFFFHHKPPTEFFELSSFRVFHLWNCLIPFLKLDAVQKIVLLSQNNKLSLLIMNTN
jgi:hypothetical protein